MRMTRSARLVPIANKVCVVTGAGSGLGRGLAVELGRRGARLALCDIDEASLMGTAEMVVDAAVHTARVDVSDRHCVRDYAHAVAARFGVVHHVYNNAGIDVPGRSVLQSGWSSYEKVLDTNIAGVIHTTQAFLPYLVTSGAGHLVNVSSMNGYFALPTLGPYCTSKFAVRGFTEVVRLEAMRDHLPLDVTVVHPGFVRTDIVKHAIARGPEVGVEVTAADHGGAERFARRIPQMDPARAAQIIVDGVQARKARVLVGADAVLVDIAVRLFPTRYHRLALVLDRLLSGGQCL